MLPELESLLCKANSTTRPEMNQQPIPADAKTKLVEHISKEIEVITNNTFAFRMKSAFNVWAAPYFVLCSFIIATKGELHIPLLKGEMLVALITAAVCYLILGIFIGCIQRGEWRRRNKLREGLIELLGHEDEALSFLVDRSREWTVIPTYIASFIVMGASFVAVAYVALEIGAELQPDVP